MFNLKDSNFIFRKKTPFWRRYFYLILFIVFVLFFIIISSSWFSNNFNRLIKKIKNEKPEPVIIYKAEETIKILEGWANADINNYLQENNVFDWSEDEFLKIVGERRIYDLEKPQNFSRDWAEEFDFLKSKPENLSLEGYLFPDTYRVFASSSPEEIVYRLLNNFDKKLSQEMRAEIKRQGKTIHEIITMASIIEKEAPILNQTNAQDAKIISGIFWNRLKIGMALQTDATLSYIFEDKKPAHSGAELKVESPYNSYLYRGLPPGPIANPGLIAIEAAIYPAQTDYFYFLTPLDGAQVYYAKTYQEHLNNKYKYLK
ncbi:endolytic transglycosylase MltG [Patescibacteria group bacterium]|nr:endolytic transglycosylase MltG [Patescibacteria group bacterium]